MTLLKTKTKEHFFCSTFICFYQFIMNQSSNTDYQPVRLASDFLKQVYKHVPWQPSELITPDTITTDLTSWNTYTIETWTNGKSYFKSELTRIGPTTWVAGSVSDILARQTTQQSTH